MPSGLPPLSGSEVRFVANPYSDSQQRTWELDTVPAHNAYAGGQVIGYLCWVKSTDPGVNHPGDFARSATGQIIVAPTVAAAIAAGQHYADTRP